MKCRFCGARIGILERWRFGDFCSKEHKDEFAVDLVRLNEAGKIVYIGRKDTQVKINGYRIDLQEIEYAAKALGARNAHAFVQDKKVYLAVTTRLDNVSAKLKTTLPMYMIPSKIAYVSELPLTANGKVDRRALPAPNHAPPDLEKAAHILRQVQELSGERVKAMLQELGIA